MKRVRWQELIVPGIIFIFVISFWMQVRGQSKAIVIIPYGTMWAILALIAIIIFTQVFMKDARIEKNGLDVKKAIRFKDWFMAGKSKLGLIVLSVGYYFVFDQLGFTVSNLIFLLLGFTVTGLQPKKTVAYSLTTTAALFGVCVLLQLNAPQLPWFLR